MRTRVEVDGHVVNVEGDDVLLWAGVGSGDGDRVDLAEQHGPAYVRANPRPSPDAQGAQNIPARQRMALLRCLARGPATRARLLSVMRSAAGFVGADDWRNRLDELRGRGQRGGGHPGLPIEHDEETDVYRLTETFARLDGYDRAALQEAKALLAATPGLPGRAAELLDGLLPDIPPRVSTRRTVPPERRVAVVLRALPELVTSLGPTDLLTVESVSDAAAGTREGGLYEFRGRYPRARLDEVAELLAAAPGPVQVLSPQALASEVARRRLAQSSGSAAHSSGSARSSPRNDPSSRS